MSDAYFLYHSIGMYPGKADDMATALTEFAKVWGRPDDAQWGVVLPLRHRFIDRWRAIINAAPDTVTSCESVTQGLHMLIEALPDQVLRGKSLLVAADCFPSNHFLLSGMAKARGFTLKTVPLRQGAAWVEDEDFLAAWTPDVGLALLTWVSSTSSHRVNLQAMAEHGRRMGSLVGVDITQGAGLLPFDVAAPAVDFVLSTSLKWMCGTPGAGMLYADPALIATCQPQLRGWFSQPDPFNWDITRFAYAQGIRRFDSGTPSCMAALASLPALDWHAGQDHVAILAHNRALTERLFQIADDFRLPVLTPRPAEERGGSVMLRLPDDRPAGQIVAALRDQGVTTDCRGQTLRLSPGVLTTAAGCDQLARALAGLLRP
ncbi:aminotransferase class V-fold PLP-dependent enzyme [Tabrizicola sp.]|uniref:aminotransferase class V-fold PLP-dependent enzyme n=1 Tax=Tabrizicola sp. TaxID=2005166 RepID=UPI0026390FCF|nr:aminotransferase class V-fold PLP-dependent enzyme [Tabrizicola sp.]MDM7932286.1 aminotransferase class V-fold PLP-dependent enzyme [Tabrizicola sp.]